MGVGDAWGVRLTCNEKISRVQFSVPPPNKVPGA